MPETIYRFLRDHPDQFSTLVQAIDKSQSILTKLSSETNKLTLFAPKNFQEIQVQSNLEDILNYHIVEGINFHKDLYQTQILSTDLIEESLNGAHQKISISIDTGIVINSMHRLLTESECKNGVVHVIDSILPTP